MKSALLLLCIAFILACTRLPVYPEAERSGDFVKIEIDKIQHDQPEFFTFHNGNKGINFFVLKTGEDIRSYFDACARCYTKKMGYSFNGRRFICRACNVEYSVYDLKNGIGSCYPLKLKGEVKGGNYLIGIKDILRGDKFF